MITNRKSFQMSSNVDRNNKKILRNLKMYFTWAHFRNLLHETFLSFLQHLKRFRRKKSKLWGFVGTKPNLRVSWRRFRNCAQVKHLFRFRRIFLLFLSTFELIWKLSHICRTFLVSSGEIFFLECSRQ